MTHTDARLGFWSQSGEELDFVLVQCCSSVALSEKQHIGGGYFCNPLAFCLYVGVFAGGREGFFLVLLGQEMGPDCRLPSCAER